MTSRDFLIDPTDAASQYLLLRELARAGLDADVMPRLRQALKTLAEPEVLPELAPAGVFEVIDELDPAPVALRFRARVRAEGDLRFGVALLKHLARSPAALRLVEILAPVAAAAPAEMSSIERLYVPEDDPRHGDLEALPGLARQALETLGWE